jgi:hypothetical protein
LAELKQEMKELKIEIKRATSKIETFNDSKDVDLSYLQIDGAGLKDLYRTLVDLKDEIL